MRKLILIAACALAGAALPSLAGAGAVHGSETFTETFTMFGPDPCVNKVVTGTATQSETVSFVEPPSGGEHLRIDLDSGLPRLVHRQPGDPDGELEYRRRHRRLHAGVRRDRPRDRDLLLPHRR